MAQARHQRGFVAVRAAPRLISVEAAMIEWVDDYEPLPVDSDDDDTDPDDLWPFC